MSLPLINETGLTHVARCCLGATTTLQTGTAFRRTAVQPSVVNAESAAPQRAFSATSSFLFWACVCGGSADAAVVAASHAPVDWHVR